MTYALFNHAIRRVQNFGQLVGANRDQDDIRRIFSVVAQANGAVGECPVRLLGRQDQRNVAFGNVLREAGAGMHRELKAQLIAIESDTLTDIGDNVSNGGHINAPLTVFGLVGPIECPIPEASESLASTLKKMYYTPTTISLSKKMDRLLAAKGVTFDDDSTSVLHNKIRNGNAVREAFGNNAVLTSEAIRQIVDFRRAVAAQTGEHDEARLGEQAVVPLDQHAFIVDQLKLPVEVDRAMPESG